MIYFKLIIFFKMFVFLFIVLLFLILFNKINDISLKLSRNLDMEISSLRTQLDELHEIIDNKEDKVIIKNYS